MQFYWFLLSLLRPLGLGYGCSNAWHADSFLPSAATPAIWSCIAIAATSGLKICCSFDKATLSHRSSEQKPKKNNEALESGCWIISVNGKTCPVQIREQLHTASKLFVIFEHGIAVSSYWRGPEQIRAQLHRASVLTVIFENGIVVSSYWKYIRRNNMTAPEPKLPKFLR